MEEKDKLDADEGRTKELVVELLTPPPVEDTESQRWRWWSEERYKVGSLTGKQQAAAIYLGHIKNAPGWQGWILSHVLRSVMGYSPELIVMVARMKQLMLED